MPGVLLAMTSSDSTLNLHQLLLHLHDLVQVDQVVPCRRHQQQTGAGQPAPVLRHARGVGSHRTLGDQPRHPPRVHAELPFGGVECAHILARAFTDLVAVIEHGWQIDIQPQLHHLVMREQVAGIAHLDVELLLPAALGEHLLAVRQHDVHGGILDARRVPHDPRRRVLAALRDGAPFGVTHSRKCDVREREGGGVGNCAKMHSCVLTEEQVDGGLRVGGIRQRGAQ